MHPALNHAVNQARIAELHRQAQQRRDAAVAGAGRRSRLIEAFLRGLRALQSLRHGTTAVADRPAPSSG